MGQLYFGFDHGSLVSIKYLRTRVLVICSETERSNHTWVCLLGLPLTTAGIYSFVLWPQLVCNILFSPGRASFVSLWSDDMMLLLGKPCVPCNPVVSCTLVGRGATAK